MRARILFWQKQAGPIYVDVSPLHNTGERNEPKAAIACIASPEFADKEHGHAVLRDLGCGLKYPMLLAAPFSRPAGKVNQKNKGRP